MSYKRTSIQLDREEADKALERAKAERKAWEVSLSDLIRALIRKYAKGGIKL